MHFDKISQETCLREIGASIHQTAAQKAVFTLCQYYNKSTLLSWQEDLPSGGDR